MPVKYSSTSSLSEPDRFEHLRAGVGGDGGDAHLRHHLEDALARRLDVVLHGLVGVDAGEAPLGDHVFDRFEREVGVDRSRAVAHEQRHVMHLAGISGLDDESDLGAGLLADQVVVHGRRHQERWDRRELLGRVAVGEHEDARTAGDRLAGIVAERVERLRKGRPSPSDGVETVQHDRSKAGHVPVFVDVDELGELVVVDDREREGNLPARRRCRREQVALRPDRGPE